MRYDMGVLGRTVLDTDVLVAAVRSDRGASRVVLTAALEQRYPTLASVPLMLQYESVLTRAEHLAAAHFCGGRRDPPRRDCAGGGGDSNLVFVASGVDGSRR